MNKQAEWFGWGDCYCLELGEPGEGSACIFRFPAAAEFGDSWAFKVQVGTATLVSPKDKYPVAELERVKADAEECLRMLRGWYEQLAALGFVESACSRRVDAPVTMPSEESPEPLIPSRSSWMAAFDPSRCK